MRHFAVMIAAGLAGLFVSAQSASAMPIEPMTSGVSLAEQVQLRCPRGSDFNRRTWRCERVVRRDRRQDLRRPVCPRGFEFSQRRGRCVRF